MPRIKGKPRRGVKRRRCSYSPPPIIDEAAEFDDSFSDLRTDMKRNRERFCREYIKDFNAANAMRRLGSKSRTPQVRGHEWLQHPYTQWFLSGLLEKLDASAIVTRNEVLVGLKREAHYFDRHEGSPAARIAALRTLGKILGMEITKVEGNMTIGGGVMVLPMSGTPEEWEKAAAMAQANLKKRVRE